MDFYDVLNIHLSNFLIQLMYSKLNIILPKNVFTNIFFIFLEILLVFFLMSFILFFLLIHLYLFLVHILYVCVYDLYLTTHFIIRTSSLSHICFIKSFTLSCIHHFRTLYLYFVTNTICAVKFDTVWLFILFIFTIFK